MPLAPCPLWDAAFMAPGDSGRTGAVKTTLNSTYLHYTHIEICRLFIQRSDISQLIR